MMPAEDRFDPGALVEVGHRRIEISAAEQQMIQRPEHRPLVERTGSNGNPGRSVPPGPRERVCHTA